MAGQGDDFLRGVLGEDYFADERPGDGDDPRDHPTGDVPSATDQTTAAMDVARTEEHARYEDVTGIAAGVVPQPPPVPGAPPPAPPGSGGGYTFDAETISALITEFDGLANEIFDAYSALEDAAAEATPPAHDESAVRQARATADSVNVAARHNQAMHDYVMAFLRSLRKANGTYEEREEEAAGIIGGVDRSGATGALFE